ncbi:NACHT domain-containing protein [Phyllobacterium ifriqiyense]|uniref:NACHT domain-containing protein n=1 Tax=Phyllobacterium ifriqiyense TaxID=314238 RepID=UPI003393FC0F
MSESEINVNEIAGHAVADLVESFLSSVGNNTKEQIAKLKIRVGKGFSRYLSETLDRYSKFKTLINRYDAIELSNNYVPARIKNGTDVFRSDDFFASLVENKRLIVEGTAGLGKTLFVRHMLRHTILYEKKFIPILFELRNLHLDNSQTLTANLVMQVAHYVPSFTEEHLRFGMERGKFIIYLDGIDEISLKDRTRYASEILDLAYRYTETPILLSTRPDDFYIPWETFRVAKLLPMTREQTSLMLSKLQFDPEVKKKFLEEITPEYFQQHSEFLSIPLLATLMMLTYSEFSAVPNTMHVFYEQAYQTLFHKHDFIKGAYSRTIETGLDVEQFRQALAAFCFITYLQERFSFLQYQALEDIKAALSLARVECHDEAFLKDLLVTVCLLQRDGNYITFVHRSFQEYFAALFISKSPPSEIFAIFEALVSRGRVDAVIRMTLQLNDGVVEQEWVLPKLRAFDKAIDNAKTDFDLVKSAVGAPQFRRGVVFAKLGKIDWNSLLAILNEYSPHLSLLLKTDDYSDDAGRILRYVNQQQALADKEQPYNRAALGAQKRGAKGETFNLAVLPSDFLNDLKCIKDAARAVRELQRIKVILEEKQQDKRHDIRGLLSKYKK